MGYTSRSRRISSLRALSILLAGAFSLLGCKKNEPVLPPVVKMNSDPDEKYRVVMEITDHPTETLVSGEAGYFIQNRSRCVPLDHGRSIGGSRPFFRESLPVPVIQMGKNRYEALFYRDAILSEDYYGLGVCHWDLGARFYLQVGGIKYTVSSAVSSDSKDKYRAVCRKDLSTGNGTGSCKSLMYFKDEYSAESYFLVEVKSYKE